MPRKPSDVPIQVVLAEDNPLLAHLDAARARIGVTRAGYLKRLLEQDLLRQRDPAASAMGPAAAPQQSEVKPEVKPAVPQSPAPALETDEDLLAGFLGD